jgi:hypothetical protein
MSIRFTPSPVPNEPENLAEYLEREFGRMSVIINNNADGHFDVLNNEPNKRRAGDVRYADGTNWNPGSGEGLYIYLSTGAWSKL